MFQLVDDSTPVWRYMDFDKFVASLFPSTLRFSSFSAMADHTEGRWYRFPGEHESADYRKVATHIYVNCWTLNDPSSGRPWEEYTTPSKGIALASTFGKLRHEYHANNTDDIQPYVSKVRYTDDPLLVTPSSDIAVVAEDIATIAITKSSHFSWENEVRIIAVQTNGDAPPWDSLIGTINVSDLVDDILVFPDAEPWLEETLKRVVQKQPSCPNHMYAAIGCGTSR